MVEIPAWIGMHEKERRSTEVFVPLLIGIGPVWGYNDGGHGGWFGFIEVNLPLNLDPVWECDHIHDHRAEAWACAEGAVAQLVETALAVSDVVPSVARTEANDA